jgi:DNA polymerase-3 subunit chi
MTERVDFYVLKSSTAIKRWTFACRLTEKAYLRDLKVVLYGETAAEVEAMDELLWTFSERSFVPHEIVRGRPAGGAVAGGGATPVACATTGLAAAGLAAAGLAPAVHITQELESVEAADLLVNLGARLPERLDRFARIAEIIDADEDRRRLGRERFKAYRDLKLSVETHQLDEAAGA